MLFKKKHQSQSTKSKGTANQVPPIDATGKIPLIIAKDLVKTYSKAGKKFNANDGINLTIYKGENIAIIGPNGAGKTTFIEMICGVRTPTEGEINYYFNNNLPVAMNMGVQFQESKYPEGVTVNDILKFYLEIYKAKLSKQELERYVKIFQIEDSLKKRIASMSGGQQQRLNVLLSILHHPNIIILDEISTGLDIQARQDICSFIKELAERENLNLILISHNMDEVQFLAKRLVLIDYGKIQYDFEIKDIVKKFGSVDNFVKNYFARREETKKVHQALEQETQHEIKIEKDNSFLEKLNKLETNANQEKNEAAHPSSNKKNAKHSAKPKSVKSSQKIQKKNNSK